ncbi:hypothetical protein OGAPHI_000549 [Ogataea philodendri]|uniref:FAD dependent oxidoreductase domain-containing protein n=1 Tax=Ogataea philodendri TaxID=1378263 RepID=A0A9P8T9Y5_9ASCO|nr:uncharacterized protein OGAPHI_000549 [Ogataea philodendri]KAH3671326.1 hypothetical protein OGAPHI_000549 [Ogataea philodendri]
MPSVLIVGCGVFGLSTARDLSRRGYSVVALDAYEPPSPWSAANDFNKIIRAEYTDLIYSKMAVEAIHQWRDDPDLKGLYNECGRIMVTPMDHVGRQEFEKKGISNLRKLNEGLKIKYLKGNDALAEICPELGHNSLGPEQEFKFNPESGLGHAGNSLKTMYLKCKQLGVKFVFGDAGRFTGLEKKNGKVYARAANGQLYTADQLLICCGANTGKCMDLKQQQSATALYVAHIKLTPEEYSKYKDIPILFDSDMGYFFPPDPATRVIKIALPGIGASNLVADPHGSDKEISLPRYHNANPSDTMPKYGYDQVVKLLAKYCPDLAYHMPFNAKTCWIGDTADSHFIIDQVPGYENTFVATGDSGHGYKFLPNIGKYIVARLENTLDPELKNAWKWRAGAIFDPFSIDWRVAKDFPDLKDVDWWIEQKPKL